MSYQKHDQNSRDISNIYRKQKLRKQSQLIMEKLIFKFQDMNYQHLNQRLLKKHERNISRIEDQILFLYSKGMSTRDIQETIYQMFFCDLDKDTISRITDKIIPEIVMWQQRLLEFVYPIMYIDGIRFKIREDSVHKEKSVYLIIGVNIEGKKRFWTFG